jgi:chaperone BCS1
MSGDVDEEEMDEEDEEELEYGRRKRKVTFMPSPGKPFLRSALALVSNAIFSIADTTHTIFYRGHWLKVRALDHGTSQNGR